MKVLNPLLLEDRSPLLGPDNQPVFLHREHLRPGDVLLMYTDPEPLGISWWVRKLTGGWYSHASFFDGKQIIEASREDGITETLLQKRILASHYVDVYRFISDDDHAMGSEGLPPEPVVEAIHRYLERPFGTSDLIFGALIAVSRPWNLLPGDLESDLRRFLDRAMQKAQDLIYPEAPEHITCSELIYRGFGEARPPSRYRLRIETGAGDALRSKPAVLRGDATVADSGLTPETQEILSEFAQLYYGHKERFRRKARPSIDVHVAGEDYPDPDLVPDYVSPHDLSRCLNLKQLGRACKNGFGGP